MKISFAGDVMLGRFVGEKYASMRYDVVSPGIVGRLRKSDVVIANLESPVISKDTEREDHHLKFLAEESILKEFDWVSCFSLSNNHINDNGSAGMEQTMDALDRYRIQHNGLFKEEYVPYIIEKAGCRIAIVTCDDLMNYEFTADCPWKTLRVGDQLIDETIKKYKEEGYFIILYAHVGMLFTRFPSPAIREYLQGRIDLGADLVVTVHSHALGGMEYYKGVPVFHSLGDFVMDGSSFRRRQNYILDVNIEDNKITKWEITPTIINFQLETVLPEKRREKKMRSSFANVSKKLSKHTAGYPVFYKKQYKKEMLAHSLSTLHFLMRTKGVIGMFRMVYVRLGDVLGMAKRVTTDRSQMRYDTDIDVEKGKISNNTIR